MTEQLIRFGEEPYRGVTRILSELALAGRPRWSILELALGPGSEGCLPDEERCGAPQPLQLSDELLFGDTSLVLRSLRVKVPEVNASSSLVSDWMQAPKTVGLPQLRSRELFDVAIASARAYLPQRDCLAVLHRTAPPTSQARRLEINADLEVLVEGEIFAGWLLVNASANAATPVSSQHPRLPLSQSESARKFLGEFLSCMDDDLVRLMEVKDCRARGELVRLREVARAEWSDGIHELLAEWLDDIEDTFYA